MKDRKSIIFFFILITTLFVTLKWRGYGFLFYFFLNNEKQNDPLLLKKKKKKSVVLMRVQLFWLSVIDCEVVNNDL